MFQAGGTVYTKCERGKSMVSAVTCHQIMPRSSSVANTTDKAKEIPTGDLHQLPVGPIKHL